MGLRERLEVIRENNRDVEGRPNFEYGFPGYRVPQPDIPLCGRPLLSIWFRPQDTIQRVVWHKGEWWILGLGAAAGVARALTRVSSRGIGDRLSFELLVAGCLILGPVLQLVMIYLGGLILLGFGRMVGGKASYAEVRAALAWGALPQAVMLFPWILALAFFGSEMFSHVKPTLSSLPYAWLRLVLFNVLNLILVVWSLILTVSTLVAVFRMSVLRLILAILMMTAVSVGLGVLGYLVWSSSNISSLDFSQFVAARKSAPATPPRKTLRPSQATAPEAALLWDQGYAVTIRDPLGRKQIRRIELGADLKPGVTDEAILHIGTYRDLEVVIIKDASELTDRGLGFLSLLPNLASISIEGSKYVTDDGLAQLRSLSKLDNVQIANCPRVTGRGLTLLGKDGDGAYEGKKYALYELSISDGQVSAEGLQAIAAAPPPHHLSLNRMQVGDADLAHLIPIAHLSQLTLRENQIEGPGLESLAKIVGLRELDLSGNPLSDEAVPHLLRMNDLARLNLVRTMISEAGIQSLRKRSPRLKVITEEAPYAKQWR